MTVEIIIGDMRERLRDIAADSIDSCATDPPYHLTSIVKRFGAENSAPCKVGKTGAYARASKGFMGQTWDGGDVAFQPETWAEVLRVLKPGGHMVAFSGTRTYHRMVCAIEDAGFEIRDQLAWVYGSGFPKSHDVSKGIDKLAGAEREVVSLRKSEGGRTSQPNTEGINPQALIETTAPATEAAQQWQGWGTALKPAWEPICLARKPLVGTVAANVLKYGTGALNIDGCRIETDDGYTENAVTQGINTARTSYAPAGVRRTFEPSQQGRWPANIIHDGSAEVLAGFPDSDSKGGGGSPSTGFWGNAGGCDGQLRDDTGSAARFFYCAKAAGSERGEGNNHPTVKPVDLMRWLCRLVTPKGGTVLDPFMGSGSTLIAADREQLSAIGIEMSQAYADIAKRRLSDDRGGLLDAMEAA